MSEADETLEQMKMNTDDLYREEVFTDRHVGTIQRLTPVTADGADDASRPVLYLGQTQVMTPVGALPLNFELDAETLEQAIEKFPEAAKKSLDQTMEQLREMQREQASRIMTPDQMSGLGGGGPTGGGQGGPGIQLR